jgi:hypothetical protein
MLLNGVAAFDLGLGPVGGGGPPRSPVCMVVLILRLNCWNILLEGRGLDSGGGGGGGSIGTAPEDWGIGSGDNGSRGAGPGPGIGTSVVVVVGIDGGGGGFDMSCAFLTFASSAAA